VWYDVVCSAMSDKRIYSGIVLWMARGEGGGMDG
jgi:hypothetical protein